MYAYFKKKNWKGGGCQDGTQIMTNLSAFQMYETTSLKWVGEKDFGLSDFGNE